MRNYFLIVVLFVSLGCKKEKVVEVQNIDQYNVNSDTILIDGNSVPPDSSVALSIKENYVNKLYISLLGREPSSSELSDGLIILNQNELSIADREQLIDQIQNKSDYLERIYISSFRRLLNNADTSEVTENIILFEFLLTDSAYLAVFPQIQMELDRFYELRPTLDEMILGTTDIFEMHKRLLNNGIYDEINMGTENFVTSSFEHFLERFPTTAELDESKNIVDGLGGVLFMEYGISKDDYLDIFFGSNDYFEGQVNELFNLYLFRNPTSVEAQSYTASYASAKDYKELQKSILKLNEYVGL